MEIIRKKLVAKKDQVFNIDGKYMYSISMTDKSKALLKNDGWEKCSESWLDYRNRTEGQRQAEEIIRFQIADEMATAYNEKFNL